MPRTVLRSATKSPVRYSAKWRRWHSLAKRSPYWAKAFWTSLGNSMIPGMIVCSTLQLRQGLSSAKRAEIAYFITVAEQFAKPQLYLPESWSADRPRCREAGIPDEMAYRPK